MMMMMITTLWLYHTTTTQYTTLNCFNFDRLLKNRTSVTLTVVSKQFIVESYRITRGVVLIHATKYYQDSEIKGVTIKYIFTIDGGEKKHISNSELW